MINLALLGIPDVSKSDKSLAFSSSVRRKTWRCTLGLSLGLRPPLFCFLLLFSSTFDSNVEVMGTNSKAQDIVGPISFNDPLYWVDTDREGAKEWIQGYVKHFIDI